MSINFPVLQALFLWALLAVILIVHRITGIAGDFIFYVVVSAGRKFSHSKKA